MQSTYSLIRQKLDEQKIYFNVDGSERHKQADIILFAENVLIEPYSAFLSGNQLCTMGSFSYSWSPLPIDAHIGRYCSIARGVGMVGNRHPYEWISSSSFTYDARFIIFKRAAEDFSSQFKVARPPVTHANMQIGHDVWIGANTVLKRGIKIGTGSVIAGNSVVTKDVPPYAIVGGNPAKIIKMRFSDEIIADLLASRWWEYKFTDFQDLDIKEPGDFLKRFNDLVYDGRIAPYCPQVLTARDLMVDY